jgi:hypothetical protein
VSLAGGRNEIELVYKIGDQEGTETIPIIIPTSTSKVTRTTLTPQSSNGIPGPALAAIAVVLFLGVNFLLFRRARRAGSSAA